MKFRASLLTLSFFLILGIAWSPVASGVEKPALDAVLINSRELFDLTSKKLVTDAARLSAQYIKLRHVLVLEDSPMSRFTENYLNETDPICAAIKHGCITIAYLDPSNVIHYHGPHGFHSSIEARDFEMTESDLDGSYPDLNGQLEMDDFLTIESGLLKTDLHAAAQAKGYYDFPSLKTSEEDLIQKSFEDLKAGKINADNFEDVVLKHPRAFAVLSTLHQQMIQSFPDPAKQKRPPYAKALEDTISDALLLTVNGLWIAADSNIDSFPYTDGTVALPDQLNLKALYTGLKNPDPKLDRWPKIQALNPEIRNAAKGNFLKKTQVGDRWRVKGSFNSIANVIWIDEDQPFFESIFVLYHELFHVAHHYSDKQSNILYHLETAIPEDNEVDQRGFITASRQFVGFLVENEMGGIIQQAKLFHAIGPMVTYWQGTYLDSAAAWHDYLYFGSGALSPQQSTPAAARPPASMIRNVVPVRDSLGRVLSENVQEVTPAGSCPAEHLYITRQDRLSLAAAGHICPLRTQQENGSKFDFHPDMTISPPIFQDFFGIFDRIYFNTIFNQNVGGNLQQDYDLLDFTLQKNPYNLKLTCKQMGELAQEFSHLSHWTFGIPVPYEIKNFSDGDPSCHSFNFPAGHLGGGYIGAEGSHGGVDGLDLSNPGVDGLPNIDGADYAGGGRP